jgi:hypothetical protein
VQARASGRPCEGVNHAYKQPCKPEEYDMRQQKLQLERTVRGLASPRPLKSALLPPS